MIKINNLKKKYQEKTVFSDFSAQFNENAINIIFGPSGCGKTTLFNILSGIDNDYKGTVENVPKEVGYLFQEDRLLPYYSVLENVLFTMPDDIKPELQTDIALKNLGKMNIEEEKNTYPHKLSGGMSRRVAIARTLSYPCKLMLLDEPFNGLNIELKQLIVAELDRLVHDNQLTIIIITHDLSPFEGHKNIKIIDLKI